MFGLTSGAQTFFLLFILCVIIILSTGMGYIKIPPFFVLKIIASKIIGNPEILKGIDNIFPFVVLEVRLPRMLTSAIVGAGLSISGVIFQGILLNPLADPYTLGISAGAAFGASIALFLNINIFGIYSVLMFAFIGAVITLFTVMSLSSFNGQMSSNNLVLSGIIIASILSAGISFIKYMADEQVSIIIFWLMGSFTSMTWINVCSTLLFVLIGFFISIFFARDLNIMSLGDRSAGSMGVETNKVRITLLVTASLITAICVSVSGIIGFVGLIVPHLMRFFVGPDNRKLFPVCAIVGAILLLIADTTTRAVLPKEIPIGVLTALFGGPFFCFIFRQKTLPGNTNG